jgi:protein-glutamine gamma-glutamyltransferase
MGTTGVEAARLPLRIAVLLAGLAGLMALGTAQLLSLPVTLGVAACFTVASFGPIWLTTPAEATLRRRASITVLILVAGYAVHAALAGLGQDPLESIGPVLAVLLAGLEVAHALVLNARRDLLVGLTIGLFMTVLAAGLAPGPSVAVPLLLGWPVAVTALVLAQRLEQLEAGHPVARPGRPARTGRATTSSTVVSTTGAVVITMVAGLVVFLLLPQPDGLSARSRLLGSDAQLDAASGEVRSSGYYSGGVMDLRTRGSLSDAPVMDVPADSPLLWRGTVLATYDGQAWYGTTGSLTQLTDGPTYVVPPQRDTSGTGLLESAPRTDAVSLLDQFSGTIVAPGMVTSVTVDGRVLVDGDGGLILTSAPGSAGLASTYTVTSVPEITDPVALARAGSATAGDPADPRWLQLPAALPGRVRDLAQVITEGKSNRVDQVRAVETYLRANEKYQLDSPVPAPGADAVDDFLFTSNAGFCEQFASAEVVLLRSRGIPARMVTGLAYGTPEADGMRRLLVSDAHAWVEVWYPGIGWSPSDPTAGSTLAQSGAPTFASTLWHDIFDSAVSRALAAVVVGLLALLGVAALRWARRKRRLAVARAAAAGTTAGAGPVLLAFRRLERALADTGRARRPGETVAELARRLPADSAGALATLQRECYSAAEVPDDEAVQAADTLDGLARTLAEVTRQ